MDNSIKFPESDAKRIIVPIREELFMFEKNTYRTDYLSHIIGKQEYDNILIEGTRVMGNAWSKKRNNDIVRSPPVVKVLAIISVLFVILYFIFLFISVNSKISLEMLIVSLVSVGIGSMIAFGLSIYNYTRKINSFKSIQEIIRDELNEFFSNVNAKYERLLQFVFKETYVECNILKENDDPYKRRKTMINTNKSAGFITNKNDYLATDAGLIKED